MEWWMSAVPGLALFPAAVSALTSKLHAGERGRQDRRLARAERKAWTPCPCGRLVEGTPLAFGTCSVECENTARMDLGV